MKVKFNKFPSEVADVLASNNSAKMALSRLENGTKDTEHTWFYEDKMKKDPETVIAPVVSKLKGMSDWPKIASWDLSKLDKFQAQGRSAPFEERLPLFEEYFEHLKLPELLKGSNALWRKAKAAAADILGFNQSGSPLSITEVVERGISAQKYGTSSGYPLFLKRKNPSAIAEAVRAAEGNKAILDKYPFMVGSRAQMGKVGNKARFIFMAPMAVNICGQRYAEPLQEYLTQLAERKLRSRGGKAQKPEQTPSLGYVNRESRLLFFTPWLGWDKVQEVVSYGWYDSNLRFGADYTKMDQHFNIHHAMEVYDVIKYFFQRKYWDELKLVIQYPFTAPVITSKGYIDQEHALLSGSEWTNLIETVWNFIFQIFIMLSYKDQSSKIIPMGIGDDQMWLIAFNQTAPASTSEQELERERFSFLDHVIKAFDMAGLPGNPEKQEGVEDPEVSGFLQRYFMNGYNGPDNETPAAGVYSLVRNVTSQVYPERYHNDPEYDWKAFAIRVIMIAENCCKHPLFEWYVKDYIAKSNSNVLRFVRLTDSEIDAKWNAVKNMAGFRPNYNQEKQDKPLTQFETFKLLRTLVK